VTPGGQAGLFAAHHAALDEGDAGLLIDPYLRHLSRHDPGGGRPTRPGRRTPRKRVSARSRRHRAGRRDNGRQSLLINSPNNPTGAVYGADTLDGIARGGEAHDLWVISDEVYDSQVWEGAHLPFAGPPRHGGADADRGLDVQEPRDDGIAPGLGRGTGRSDRGDDPACHPHDLWRGRVHPGGRAFRARPGAGGGARTWRPRS
jgi:hypothetical protein